MKKILAIILAALMLLTFVACDSANEETTTEEITTVAPETNAPTAETEGTDAAVAENAEALINATLEPFFATIAPLYGDEEHTPTADELKGYFMGGYYSEDESTVCQGAAKTVLFDNEMGMGVLMSNTLISAENMEKIDDAALFCGMNANNFTTFAYHVKNAADVEAMASAFEEAVTNNMWFCGFPEIYYAIQVGDYIIAGFGLEGQIQPMKDAIMATYTNASLICEGVIL